MAKKENIGVVNNSELDKIIKKLNDVWLMLDACQQEVEGGRLHLLMRIYEELQIPITKKVLITEVLNDSIKWENTAAKAKEQIDSAKQWLITYKQSDEPMF